MTDIRTTLFQPLDVGAPPSFDWQLDTPSLEEDNGLETAIIISLFTHRRANDDDVIPDGSDNKRGYWGDAYSDIESDLIGSRLWLLFREKDTQAVVNRARDYVIEALQWLIEDGVAHRIDVITGWVDKVSGNITETKTIHARPGVLGIGIAVYRNEDSPQKFRFDHFWEEAAWLKVIVAALKSVK